MKGNKRARRTGLKCSIGGRWWWGLPIKRNKEKERGRPPGKSIYLSSQNKTCVSGRQMDWLFFSFSFSSLSRLEFLHSQPGQRTFHISRRRINVSPLYLLTRFSSFPDFLGHLLQSQQTMQSQHSFKVSTRLQLKNQSRLITSVRRLWIKCPVCVLGIRPEGNGP